MGWIKYIGALIAVEIAQFMTAAMKNAFAQFKRNEYVHGSTFRHEKKRCPIPQANENIVLLIIVRYNQTHNWIEYVRSNVAKRSHNNFIYVVSFIGSFSFCHFRQSHIKMHTYSDNACRTHQLWWVNRFSLEHNNRDNNCDTIGDNIKDFCNELNPLNWNASRISNSISWNRDNEKKIIKCECHTFENCVQCVCHLCVHHRNAGKLLESSIWFFRNAEISGERFV